MRLYDQHSGYLWNNGSELIEALDVLQEKDVSMETRVLEKYKEWKAEKDLAAANKADEMGEIGRMLMTTSEATDGVTPRGTEENKETEQDKTEGSFGGSFSKKKGS